MTMLEFASLLAVLVGIVLLVAYIILIAQCEGIRSRIHMSEGVDNEGRNFGASVHYYPAYVQVGSEWRPALFTRVQLEAACERAQDNPEDVPPMARWWQLWVERL